MKRKPLALINGKITQLNALDALVNNNFSYKQIEAGEFVNVAHNQQMIVTDRVRIDGEMRVDGEVRVDPFLPIPAPSSINPDNFSYSNIVAPITVPTYQQMSAQDFVRVEDMLQIAGSFVVAGVAINDFFDRLVNNVLVNKSYYVRDFEEYSFRNALRIDGTVSNSGLITIGA